MPVQKGKQRKRPRNRGPREAVVQPEPQQQPAKQTRSSRPVRRRRFEGPPWFNIILGVSMLVIGGSFVFVFPDRRMGDTWRVFLFVGYLALAAFYFAKAYRQIQRRRQGSG